MKLRYLPDVRARALLALLASAVAAPALAQDRDEERGTIVAVRVEERQKATLDMVGTAIHPGVLGRADVDRDQNRTRIRLRLDPLPYPLSVGSNVTTYVLWAVAPEGRTESLAELPHGEAVDVKTTTTLGTFGLMVTAEPHGAVTLPGLRVMAENRPRPDTDNRIDTSRIEYRSEPDVRLSTAVAARGENLDAPLAVLGARLALEMARQADLQNLADEELDAAETRMAVLDEMWPRNRNKPKDWLPLARDVMRLAEEARQVAIERADDARLQAEREAQRAQVASAQLAADLAGRDRAEAQAEAEQAQALAEAARADAQAAKAEADKARAEAEEARRQVEEHRAAASQAADAIRDAEDAARRAQDEVSAERARAEEARQRLFESLSQILETRKEARGLIVSLSDVLFDFNKASLKPGARERLSKLTGILLAYPEEYRIDIEGHTDSVGSDTYNQRLSRERAESVKAYLLTAGLPTSRMGSTLGFGEARPVAGNESAEGRQRNRRVEIVIQDVAAP